MQHQPQPTTTSLVGWQCTMPHNAAEDWAFLLEPCRLHSVPVCLSGLQELTSSGLPLLQRHLDLLLRQRDLCSVSLGIQKLLQSRATKTSSFIHVDPRSESLPPRRTPPSSELPPVFIGAMPIAHNVVLHNTAKANIDITCTIHNMQSDIHMTSPLFG